MNSQQRAYRTAIALNNMGVSLLRRGSYNLAQTTFREALKSLNQILNHRGGGESQLGPRTTPPPQSQHEEERNLDAVQQAIFGLCKKQEEEGETASQAPRLQVKSVFYSRGETINVPPGGATQSSNRVVWPIWIEMEAFQPDPTGQEKDIECSIVHFNLAVANTCLLHQSTTSTGLRESREEGFVNNIFQHYQLSLDFLLSRKFQLFWLAIGLLGFVSKIRLGCRRS